MKCILCLINNKILYSTTEIHGGMAALRLLGALSDFLFSTVVSLLIYAQHMSTGFVRSLGLVEFFLLSFVLLSIQVTHKQPYRPGANLLGHSHYV